MKTSVRFLISLLLLSSCGDPAPAVESEAAKATLEELRKADEAFEQQAAADSLSDEQLDEVKTQNAKRFDGIEESIGTTAYKDMKDEEIEPMIAKLLQAYEASRSTEDAERIATAMEDYLVKMYYDRPENYEKRKAVARRMKEVASAPKGMSHEDLER